MIPKIIHCCWFGGKELPEQYKRYIDSWRKTNPDYEIRIWTDETFKPFIDKSEFCKYCIENKIWGFLSDYFRFVVLYEYGGIYLDTDVEVYRSFDELLDCRMFMGFIFDCLLGTAVIGSEKGNPIMLEWRDILLRDFDRKGALTVSNSWVTRYFLDKYPLPTFKLNGKEQEFDGIRIYPRQYFEKECFWPNRGGYARHFCDNSWRKGRPLPIRIAKKVLPRRIVAYFSHYVNMRKNEFYKIYLTHKEFA